MSNFDRALEIAIKAHAGQMYSNDEPYIFHVMRVVLACPDEEERIVAALHDVVEDASDRGWDMDVMKNLGFDSEIVEAVDAITRRKGRESYMEYIDRCSRNKLARRVKMIDLEENSSHLENVTDAIRRARLRMRYAQAMMEITRAELSQN